MIGRNDTSFASFLPLRPAFKYVLFLVSGYFLNGVGENEKLWVTVQFDSAGAIDTNLMNYAFDTHMKNEE